MVRHCAYKYVAGPKKGKECGRFIRLGGEYCYQHKPKKVKSKDEKPKEVSEEEDCGCQPEVTEPTPKKNDTEKVTQLTLDSSSTDSISSLSESSSFESSD